VVQCQQVGFKDAADHIHLLYAAQHGFILISHDTGFKSWSPAWRDWTAAWGVAMPHSGVLITPTERLMPALRASEAIDEFVRRQIALENRCFLCDIHGHWAEALL
jgi:hypothetical protein